MTRRTAVTVATGLRRLALLAALGGVLLGLGDRDAPRPERLPDLDVIVVVDRTTSMSAVDDPAGSRITAAGQNLVTLSRGLESARFAVVTVGQTAQLALPPTTDRVAFEDVVTHLTVEAADAGSGSASDRAVPVVDDLLDDEDESRRPVLVYAGDGEDNVTNPAYQFGDLRERLSAALVLGYGTEVGGVMPLVLARPGARPGAEPANVTDPRTGRDAISRVDSGRLAAIAEQAGAGYLHPVTDDELAAAVERLQRTAYADLPPVQAQRQLSWVWGLGLLLLVLPELRAGWRTWWSARRAVDR